MALTFVFLYSYFPDNANFMVLFGRNMSRQNRWSVAANDANTREDIMDLDSEKVIAVEKEVDISVEVVQDDTITCHADVECGLDVSSMIHRLEEEGL